MSTENTTRITLTDEKDTLSIENGNRTLTGTLNFSKVHSVYTKEFSKPGNYVLFHDLNNKDVWMTIVEVEHDPKKGSHIFTAEDAGLDLLNELLGPYKADKAYPIAEYVRRFTFDSGFELGFNEIPNLSRRLEWESESMTALARLASVATQFDNAEIDFSFTVDGTTVLKKYVNVYKKRGDDTNQTLYVNAELDDIVITSDIYDLGTALEVSGGTPDGANNPITLKGYSWKDPDGRYELSPSSGILKDKVNGAKWSRLLPGQANPSGAYILRRKTYETTSQKTLLDNALRELKKISEPVVNYEIEIIDLPDTAQIGDTVNLVDEDEEVFLSARLLQLEIQYSTGEKSAVLGDFLIRESGLSQSLLDLASQLQNQANRKTYTVALEPSAMAFVDGVGTITIGAKVMDGTLDISSNFSDYRWTRLDSYGEVDPDWSSTTNTITVLPDDQPLWTYVCEVANEVEESSFVIGSARVTISNLHNGQAGIPGEPGENGQTSYLHIAYADDDQGTNFSTSDSKNRAYVGTYTDFYPIDSENYADYSWQKVKGDPGTDGNDGADGISTFLHTAWANVNEFPFFVKGARLNVLKFPEKITAVSNSSALYPVNGYWVTDEIDGRVFWRVMRTNLDLNPSNFSVFNSINVVYDDTDPVNKGDLTVPIAGKKVVISGEFRGSREVEMTMMAKAVVNGTSKPIAGDNTKVTVGTDWKTFSTTVDVVEEGTTTFRFLPYNSTGAWDTAEDFWLDQKNIKIEIAEEGESEEPTPWVPPITRQLFNTTNLFEGGNTRVPTGYSGAVVTVTKDVEVPEWEVKDAFTVKITGGTSQTKAALGVKQSGAAISGDYIYSSNFHIRNNHETNVLTVYSNGGTAVNIPPKTIGYLGIPASKQSPTATQQFTFQVSKPAMDADFTMWNPEFYVWNIEHRFTETQPDADRSYLGTYTDENKEASGNPTDYEWNLVKGSDGTDGKDGIGLKTTETTYVGSADGMNPPASGWVPSIPEVLPGQFLWTKIIWTYTDNTTKTAYTVAKMGEDGADGNDGLPGKPGVGISKTTIEYAVNTSGTAKPTSGWTAEIPNTPQGQYLWTKTTWTYTDDTSEVGYTVARQGNNGANGTDGSDGSDGIGIKASIVDYQASSSGTSAPTGTWVASPPAVAANQYLWTRTRLTMTDDSQTTSYSVGKMGADGQDGSDGKTSYLHRAWANSADGTADFSTTVSLNKGYLGTYTDFEEASSQDPTKYNWTELVAAFPRLYVQEEEPEGMKNGDQWWKEVDGVVTGYYIFNDGSWNPQKIDQAVLNIVTLNAVNMNGSIISGSKFANGFSFKENDTVRADGNTTIEKGAITHDVFGTVIDPATEEDLYTAYENHYKLYGGQMQMESVAYGPDNNVVLSGQTIFTGSDLMLSLEDSTGVFAGRLNARALTNAGWKTLTLGTNFEVKEGNPPQYKVIWQLDGTRLIKFRGQFGYKSGNMRAGASIYPFQAGDGTTASGDSYFPAEIRPNRTAFGYGATNTGSGGRVASTTTPRFIFMPATDCTYCSLESFQYIIE